MARRSLFNPWAGLAFANMAIQTTALAFEANQVIAMRLAKMAMGGAGTRKEAELMVAEKIKAMAEAGNVVARSAIAGKSDLGARKVVSLYHRKVRANRRRLSS